MSELQYSKDFKDESSIESKDVEKKEESYSEGRDTSYKHQGTDFEKKTLCRVDWYMLPLLGVLYAIAAVDRSNISVARSVGMGTDLGLTVGNRYSIISCLYFVPYILLELPSNILLRRVGARNWLTGIIIAWGAVQISMGFAPTWGILTLLRVLLGALEAGFFPALVLIITTWYKRHEVQTRHACLLALASLLHPKNMPPCRLASFYMISILIGGFSAIFAYVLSLLNGAHGITSWAWIFIVEGAITIGMGLISFFFIPDFPDKNNFLTSEQTELILKRVEADRGDAVPDKLSFVKVLHVMGDWRLWAFGMMYLCVTMPAYAIVYFITIILSGMGWSPTNSLLLSAPPYAWTVISALFFSYLSDKTRLRAPFIVIQCLITIIGLVVTAYASSANARYFGCYLINSGAGGNIPAILAYSQNNIVGQSRRSVFTAVTIGFGGIGGIFATTVFRQEDFPRYIPGLWATMGCQFVLLILVSIMSLHFYGNNKQAKEGKLNEPLEGQEGFLYTL